MIATLAAGVAVLQDERVVYVNARAARMLERAPEALIGVAPGDLLGLAAERQRRMEAFESLAGGRFEEDFHEYRVSMPDGRVRLWRCRPR